MHTDSPCFVLAIKGKYPFDDDASYLQIQFWCETEEGICPERWLAVPRHRASRFTREAINARLSVPGDLEFLARLDELEDSMFELRLEDFEDMELELEPQYVPNWDPCQLRLAI